MTNPSQNPPDQFPGAAGYRILAFSVLFALTVPRMWQRGMFLDGVLVAVLSRNLGLGPGRLWTPHYTETVDPQFFEWPPLGFAFEGMAFWVFGDHFFVERVFSLLVLFLHALILRGIWRALLPSRYDWLPILFWVLPSTVTWAAVNNMLENTQALLTSLAVYALLRSARQLSAAAAGSWAGAAGAAIGAATLVKGPVGLFPLAVPVLFWLLQDHRRPKRWAALLIGMYGSVFALAALLLTSEAAYHAISEYLRLQLVPSLQGLRGADTTRMSLFRHLVAGVMMRLAIGVGIIWLLRRRRHGSRLDFRHEAWFLLATGLAASLPMAVSPRIVGHYLIPSIPILALAAAAFALPAVSTFFGQAGGPLSRQGPLIVAGILVSASVLVVLLHGSVEPRDREMIRSLDAIAGGTPRNMTIGACQASADDWGLLAYAQRFFRLSLNSNGAPVNGWLLVAHDACVAPGNCRRAAEGTLLKLYQCQPQP